MFFLYNLYLNFLNTPIHHFQCISLKIIQGFVTSNLYIWEAKAKELNEFEAGLASLDGLQHKLRKPQRWGVIVHTYGPRI